MSEWRYYSDIYLDMETIEKRFLCIPETLAAVLCRHIVMRSGEAWRVYVWIPNNARSSRKLHLRCSSDETAVMKLLDCFLEQE